MGIEPRTDLGRINLSCKPQRRARLWMDHWYWSFSPNMEQDLYFLFISFSISFFILFFFFLFYIFFFFLLSYFWVYFCSIFWENRRTIFFLFFLFSFLFFLFFLFSYFW